MQLQQFPKKDKKLYALASALAIITIGYNVVEGVVSVFFSLEDGSMALFGFGVDSFVEVVSGVGIWHMVRRIGTSGSENLDHFGQMALKITGGGFYVLTVGLTITAAVDKRLKRQRQKALRVRAGVPANPAVSDIDAQIHA